MIEQSGSVVIDQLLSKNKNVTDQFRVKLIDQCLVQSEIVIDQWLVQNKDTLDQEKGKL